MSAERESPQGDAPARGGFAGALSARLTHDTAVYAGGAFVGFVLALVNVAVVTRFLTPAEFGQLALLLFAAALLTVAYNLSILQGTFNWVFGAAGDEDIGEDEGDEASAHDKRRALGTGLVTTFLIATVGTLLIAALAPQIAQLLLGDSSDGDLVLVAAASGAAGAIWRLGSNILRLERRPYAYLSLNSVRPVLVIAAVIPLVASGGGVAGAIGGTAIGSAAAVLVMLVVTRRSFLIAIDRADLRMIVRRGMIFVPIIVSFWIAQNVDLYLLSLFASDEDVGLYRLAGRIGAFVAYFSSALFMAWTPLVRTSTFMAAERERGRDVLGGALLTYFVLGGMLLLLGLTVSADALVRIAPPDYEDAAPLIPLLAGAFLAQGLLVAIYRVSRFPGKRSAYVASAIGSAIAFLALAAVLVPWLGASGAALAVMGAFLIAAFAMGWLSQRGPNALRIEYGRIAAGVIVALACLALARGLGSLAGPWQPLVEFAALALYPVLLVLTGLITREQRDAIREILVQAFRGGARRATPLEDGLQELNARQYAALELAVVSEWGISELAATSSSTPEQVSELLVGALRTVSGDGGSDANDAEIGEYLFAQTTVADRDALGRRLWSEGGVDPADLHTLEQTLAGLRRLPSSAWGQTRAAGTSLPPA